MSEPRTPVLALQQVRKVYHPGQPNENAVLHGISFDLHAHDFCALIGPSGSGKTSLLNLIAQLDTPSDGEIVLLGRPTRALDDAARTQLRRQALGFVFQFHHLVPAFSVLDNVLMPCMITGGKPDAEQREQAMALLDAVGLAAQAGQRPDRLSGGQQQRVAVARALITRPPLLVADEPTGNLDTQTAEQVFALFRRFHEQFGCAVLIVTHDTRLSDQADRCIRLVDGRVAADSG